MSGAQEIAAKLTKAQRQALIEAVDIAELGFMTKFAFSRSAQALHRRGLTSLSWAPSTLTPLGLAVRAILKQEQTS